MTNDHVKNLPINLGARWENGVKHHPLAQQLSLLIGEIDFHYCSDSFYLKHGGDGDNGENLCAILSEIFERNLIPEITFRATQWPSEDDINVEAGIAYEWADKSLKTKDAAISYEYGFRAGVNWLRARVEGEKK